MFGECSEECGGGVRNKTRAPKILAAFGGKNCTGKSNIQERCNIQDCPGRN